MFFYFLIMLIQTLTTRVRIKMDVDNMKSRDYNKQKIRNEMRCLGVTGFWNEHCRKIKY